MKAENGPIISKFDRSMTDWLTDTKYISAFDILQLSEDEERQVLVEILGFMDRSINWKKLVANKITTFDLYYFLAQELDKLDYATRLDFIHLLPVRMQYNVAEAMQEG